MKIIICIPFKDWMHTSFFTTFFRELENTWKEHEIKMVFSVAFPIDVARNELIQKAMEHDSDYLWFIDSDTLLSPDILEKLIKVDKDIVSALYYYKHPPYKPVAYKLNDNGVLDIPQVEFNKLMEVDSVGFGCILIKSHVIKTLLEKEGEKLFQLKEIKIGTVGEDFVFCEKARKHGFRIYVNTDAIVGHLGVSVIDNRTSKF